MSKVHEPPVNFSPWMPWEHRNLVPNSHLPGVYLLAQFEAAVPALVDTLANEIVYIGETTDQSLQGRWQQFNRSAFSGKPGHAGGMLYHEFVGDEGQTLYVAAFVPQGLSRELRTVYIRHVAARLIWEWARQWDSAPICNSRPGS